MLSKNSRDWRKLARQPGIQIALNLVDRRAKLPQRQEPAVSQLGQNEPLDDQHRGLDFCLVARVSDTTRQNRCAVMSRHLHAGGLGAGHAAGRLRAILERLALVCPVPPQR